MDNKPNEHDNGTVSDSAGTELAASRDVKQPTIPLFRFWILCVGVCLGLFLAMIDTSIVATSLYSIGTDFHDFNSVNWVALAYTLAYMGCSVTFSRISDITGRRNAFIAGYILFVAFSLGCGFAQNMNQLIAFRALQGIGGSGLYSLTMIMLPEMSPDHLKQYIGAMVGIVVAMAGVLGPVLGGLLTNYTSWRWVFWINGPVGAVSLGVFFLSWPKAEYLPAFDKRSWKEFDYPGSFLTIAAAVLVVFSFQDAGASASASSSSTQNQNNNWTSAIFLAPLIAGVICWVLLLAWQYVIQTRLSHRFLPVFPLRIFRDMLYTAGALNTLLIGFPFLLLIYVVPLRIQVVGEKSALMGGIMLLPMLVTVAIGSVLSGAINSRKPLIMELLVAGSALMVLGLGLLTSLSTSELDTGKLLGFIAFCGLGFGLTVSSSTMIATLTIAPRDYAPAQGILAQLRIFGGSIGIAASSAILRTRMEQATSNLPKREAHAIDAQNPLVRKIYAEAFQTDMIVATAITGAAFALALLCWWKERAHAKEIGQKLIDSREKPGADMHAGM